MAKVVGNAILKQENRRRIEDRNVSKKNRRRIEDELKTAMSARRITEELKTAEESHKENRKKTTMSALKITVLSTCSFFSKSRISTSVMRKMDSCTLRCVS